MRSQRWVRGALAIAMGIPACSDNGAKVNPSETETHLDSGVPSAQPSSRPSGTLTGGTSRTTATSPATSAPIGPGPSLATTALAPSASQALEPARAAIETRLSTPTSLTPLALRAFGAGAASTATLTSLKYFIRGIQVCESLDVQGSGFHNPQGCLELYTGDQTVLDYDLTGDWTPLGDEARTVEDGYVDLMSASARAQIGQSTQLEARHVRGYNYGIITWALPVKLTASVMLGTGTTLFTHDGTTTFETIGTDNFRNYFTESAVSLLDGPAEEAVVLLPNGGNWFKFQQPLQITQSDIDEGKSWVLDLVFNPDGIVKGYEGDYVNGNLRETDDLGAPIRGLTVPMIDLAPVPHRETEHVTRESYVATVDLGASAFDVRVELYTVEGDESGTVYGVDVKSLVTPDTTEAPPELSKISYVNSEDGGTAISFGSWNGTPIITGFQRLATPGMTAHANLVCATHDNRAGAEGGAAIVVNACPSPNLDVEFRLVSKSRLDGSLVFGEEPGDAGAPTAPDAEASVSDAAAPTEAGPSIPELNDAALARDADIDAVTPSPLDASVSDASVDAGN